MHQPPDEDGLAEAARALLEANSVHGEGWAYTAPSPPHYPYQWNWDSRFAARVWHAFDPERARRELEALFTGQRADGCLPIKNPALPPHPAAARTLLARLRRRFERALHARERFTQPPVPVVDLVVGEAPDPVARELLEAETAHLDGLVDARADPEDGLLRIVHPWESGMDATPAYDGVAGMDGRSPARAALALSVRLYAAAWARGFDPDRLARAGGFAVKDAAFNAIAAWNLRATARAHDELGDADAAQQLRARAERIERGLLEHAWDEDDGFFYSLGPSGEPLRCRTVGGLAPLVLGALPGDVAETLVREHLLDESAFWTQHPVPSVALDEDAFDRASDWPLWRGPTWINTNWLIWVGLRKHGYAREAERLAAATIELVRDAGFAEFYDPVTGDAMRPATDGFAWSTLAVLMWEDVESP